MNFLENFLDICPYSTKLWNYFPLTGFCYSPVSPEEDTWQAAKDKCAINNSQILSIKNEAELNFTRSNVFSKADKSWLSWLNAYYDNGTDFLILETKIILSLQSVDFCN